MPAAYKWLSFILVLLHQTTSHAQVELVPFNDLCFDGEPYPLSHAEPSGGNWSGANVVDNVFYPTDPGGYQLMYTVNTPDGPMSASQWLMVFGTPALEIEQGDPSQCALEPLSFSASIPGGTWGGIFNGLSTIYRYCEDRPVIGAGIYQLPVANGGSCVAMTDVYDLLPCIANGLEGDTTICTNDDALVYTVEVDPMTSSSVTFSGDFDEVVYVGGGLESATGIFEPSLHPPGTYVLIAYLTAPGKCVRHDTVRVTLLGSVDQLTVLPFDTLCSTGEPYELDHVTPSGGSWTGAEVADNVFYPWMPGTYTLTHDYGTPGSSCYLSASQEIVVVSPPTISQVSGSDPCSEEDWLFTADIPGGVWSGGAGPGGVVDMSCANRPLQGPVEYSIQMVNGACYSVGNFINAPLCLSLDLGPDLVLCPDSEPLELYVGGPAVAGFGSLQGMDSLLYQDMVPGVTGYFFPSLHELGSYTIIGQVGGQNYCPASDTLMILIDEPDVSLELPIEDLHIASAPIVLTGGSPGPGVYLVEGMEGEQTSFDPAEAGVGYHTITYTYTDPLTGCSNSAVDSIYVWLSVGLLAQDPMHDLQVFPNPAREEIMLVFGTAASGRVMINEVSGKLLLSSEARSSPLRVDVSNLAPGSYILTLDQQHVRIHRVLIIER